MNTKILNESEIYTLRTQKDVFFGYENNTLRTKVNTKWKQADKHFII